MKNSHEIVQKAGILPKLQLGIKQDGSGIKLTGPHKVKMIEDKILKDIDRQNGKEIFVMEYILEENGVKKSYKTKLNGPDGRPSYLVQRLSEVMEGQEIILEMKKQGAKNYVSVSNVGDESAVEIGEDYEGDDEQKAPSEESIAIE